MTSVRACKSFAEVSLRSAVPTFGQVGQPSLTPVSFAERQLGCLLGPSLVKGSVVSAVAVDYRLNTER